MNDNCTNCEKLNKNEQNVRENDTSNKSKKQKHNFVEKSN